MAKNKTSFTDADVQEFIDQFVDSEQKRSDARKLLGLMQQWSGYSAKMYGPSIIGFGRYYYRYASGHEGDAPLIGFSPRKAALSLYVTTTESSEELLTKLGKYKMAKACIYVKKLEDIDLDILEQICRITVDEMQSKHQTDQP